MQLSIAIFGWLNSEIVSKETEDRRQEVLRWAEPTLQKKSEARNTKSTKGSLSGQIQNTNLRMTITTSFAASQHDLGVSCEEE